MNSLNKIAGLCQGEVGQSASGVLTLRHGSSPQHIDMKGLNAICTDDPQP